MAQVSDNILFFDNEKERENAMYLINLDNINNINISINEVGFLLPTSIDYEMLEALTNEGKSFTFFDFYYVIIENEITYLSRLIILPFKMTSEMELTDAEINMLVDNGYDNINNTLVDLGHIKKHLIVGDIFECINSDKLLEKFELDTE